ncbi:MULTISPECIES: dihydrolipoyl dehydrogenase [unclassified Streptomyces]|uniref:dihydrolipoyl dehydrogenase n=1 Tax=unclassified Streptomyces TaxID=2593676 RepID=UPI002E284B07|nr:dihydrolipoyl dehydrogenase [Streptomyces sp. NBC_01423]WSX94021.1 dihydrolipoyl dehydrogenase [Streptomyces sp. NBC_00891]WSY08498.1 dihydrolipoyl dehydrogenase [Streptomyces sp. NBC_00890]WSZ10121.1 dihydrolipoyl dehydrogenase [Streptomyces sp. NBC_00869]WSZ22376.1 dihydrolipoyl dehydrogenase [Streptomyces sp. NBC_00870]
MTQEQRVGEADVVVIGGGTGGYSTALRAAGLGLSVVLAERDKVGGTCLHRGCIPSKAMLHAAELVDGIAEARERWGVKAVLESVDWPALVATRDDIVSRNHRGVQAHLAHAKVEVVASNAELTGPRTVRVEGYGEVTARRGIVLATGSRPRMLPGLAADGGRVVTSDDALFAPGLPDSVLVLGGGAIGVEYASLHRSMGARVTLVEAADRLVPLEDADVSRHLARGLKKRGIDVRAGTRLLEAVVLDDGVRATLRTPRGETRTVEARRLLVAVGRVPVTDGLGLAAAGLATDERGFVAPADWSRLETAVPGIHVVGDLLPPPSPGLAHASFAEGLLVAETLAGRRSAPVDYDAVPRVTYSAPQTAAVGLSEAAARDAGHDVVVNTLPLTAVAKGMVHGQGGMVKVVAERDGRVLGVHLVGPHVSEMIAESQLIVGWDAEPFDVAQHIHPHPTLSEAVGEAFLTLAGRGLHQQA